MTKTVMAIYQRGTIRLLNKLPLADNQRLKLSIEMPDTITASTKGIIHLRALTGKLIAQSPQFSSVGG